jgi:hypothetical protein
VGRLAVPPPTRRQPAHESRRLPAMRGEGHPKKAARVCYGKWFRRGFLGHGVCRRFRGSHPAPAIPADQGGGRESALQTGRPRPRGPLERAAFVVGALAPKRGARSTRLAPRPPARCPRRHLLTDVERAGKGAGSERAAGSVRGARPARIAKPAPAQPTSQRSEPIPRRVVVYAPWPGRGGGGRAVGIERRRRGLQSARPFR